LAIAALVVAGASLLVAFVALRRGAQKRKAPARPDPTLAEVGEHITRLDDRLGAIERRLDAAEAQGSHAMQHVGVVRYNPFADTGSNQSFVLAMLDARGDGFVLSSLHSRQQTRVFLKSISGGKTETAVSDEEAEAIRRATNRERVS
jgi:hypothetical protein